ncbi:hypothetical protein DICVIV_08004 [Dictyocaulus viviparus]|uniref:Uncharacterized protein n=1 Tax=Dictyocaulus viviparus TaxID=29172 RepID=A0A0D8XU73_DICVI|nr:hypothetical protein DICVIV_08004 [Dictyocaulus viviparus]
MYLRLVVERRKTCRTQSGHSCVNEKDENKEAKNIEGDKEKDEEKGHKNGDQIPDTKKTDGDKAANNGDEKKSADDKVGNDKAKEEEMRKEELRICELKPKQIKRNDKEERIAQGKEMRNKGDYPTFNDVESDWDSNKEKALRTAPERQRAKRKPKMPK